MADIRHTLFTKEPDNPDDLVEVCERCDYWFPRKVNYFAIITHRSGNLAFLGVSCSLPPLFTKRSKTHCPHCFPLLQCPFVRSHVLKRKRLPIHVPDCREVGLVNESPSITVDRLIGWLIAWLIDSIDWLVDWSLVRFDSIRLIDWLSDFWLFDLVLFSCPLFQTNGQGFLQCSFSMLHYFRTEAELTKHEVLCPMRRQVEGSMRVGQSLPLFRPNNWHVSFLSCFILTQIVRFCSSVVSCASGGRSPGPLAHGATAHATACSTRGNGRSGGKGSSEGKRFEWRGSCDWRAHSGQNVPRNGGANQGANVFIRALPNRPLFSVAHSSNSFRQRWRSKFPENCSSGIFSFKFLLFSCFRKYECE